MIKRATVISQKPSAARKGSYLTILNDGHGELRAYSTRKLDEGEEIVVSVQQGANRDPLSVEILNKKQTENWIAQQSEGIQVTQEALPSVSGDIIEELIKDSLDGFVDGWDSESTDSFIGWLSKKDATKKDIAKAIYAKAREDGYAIEGALKPVISGRKGDPSIKVDISVVSDDDYDPRVIITLYEVR